MKLVVVFDNLRKELRFFIFITFSELFLVTIATKKAVYIVIFVKPHRGFINFHFLMYVLTFIVNFILFFYIYIKFIR